eukprot:m.1640714 g.1640714  ORF g.1640714 m.1640714 type:complete len:241 (+) comp43598_c0_seq1:243-965(+)
MPTSDRSVWGKVVTNALGAALGFAALLWILSNVSTGQSPRARETNTHRRRRDDDADDTDAGARDRRDGAGTNRELRGVAREGRTQAGALTRRPTLTAAAIGVYFKSMADAVDGRWIEGAQAVLVAQASLYDVVLVFAGCTSDAEEEAVTKLIAATLPDSVNVVFCEEDASVVHIVRHLAPRLHVDADAVRAAKMQPHLNSVIGVALPGAATADAWQHLPRGNVAQSLGSLRAMTAGDRDE